jgi:hypothetical protein
MKGNKHMSVNSLVNYVVVLYLDRGEIAVNGYNVIQVAGYSAYASDVSNEEILQKYPNTKKIVRRKSSNGFGRNEETII